MCDAFLKSCTDSPTTVPLVTYSGVPVAELLLIVEIMPAPARSHAGDKEVSCSVHKPHERGATSSVTKGIHTLTSTVLVSTRNGVSSLLRRCGTSYCTTVQNSTRDPYSGLAAP